jgi:molecular chaperone GrpE
MSKDKEVKQEEKSVGKEEVFQEEIQDISPEEVIEEVVEEVPEPTMEDKYNELNDKFLRLYAEFDNYRRRTNKEKVDLIATANSRILTDLIPVLDDFERAIVNNEKSEDVDGFKEGFQLIYNKLNSTLSSKGLKPMVCKGQHFDSELHEAIANVPAPTEKEKGSVIEDVEKGYYLNDKVIRFAKVVVGQ